MNWFKDKRVVVQILIGFFGIVIAGFVFVINLVSSLPNPNEIVDIQVSQSTKIYARDGSTLLYEIYGEEKRTIIDSDEIPDYIRFATISIEDVSFYNHPAFDIRGVIRAFFQNLVRGRVVQGGSTITQQVAKNAFLSPERTIVRKLKELILAMRLEQQFSKDEILDLYINLVPYGANAYGIESAAQTYFGKTASELDLSQITLLAALPQSPSYYSPWGSHTEELEERRIFIANRMHELGYIDDVQLNTTIENKPEVKKQPKNKIIAPHFAIQIQEYLSDKYGEDSLRSDGLSVITTIDPDLQIFAEDAVKENVERNESLYSGSNGALVAIDPKTGQVLAMVGSKDYFADPIPDGCNPGKSCRFEGNFNVAVQGLRQPGSALKPFAYLTAFNNGLTPDTILWDVPTEFSVNCPSVVNFYTRNTSCYHPQNFDLIFRGPITMKEALAQSINVPAVKTLYLAGLGNTLNTLSSAGLTSLNDPERFGLSLVLGGGEVRLIELVNAYSVLANEGVYHDISMILSIEDSTGEVVEKFEESDGVRVFDENNTRKINDILSSVELRSPLYESSLGLTIFPGHQVALKTGTTNDFVDAWAFGYTPNLAVGVWAGNNNREPLSSRGSSILAAIPMWNSFMSDALKKTEVQTFNRPINESFDNPILNGNLIEGSFKSILYHINRVSDPQINNWDKAIENWLKTNNIDSRRFKVVEKENDKIKKQNEINISIKSPNNGDFIDNDVVLSFYVESSSDIDKIEIYLNEVLIDSDSSNIGKYIDYEVYFDSFVFDLQNTLIIRVTDINGNYSEKDIILYK